MEKDIVQELVECLEWYVENDDTNNYPNNEFWIEGLERARRALERYHAEEIAKMLT